MSAPMTTGTTMTTTTTVEAGGAEHRRTYGVATWVPARRAKVLSSRVRWATITGGLHSNGSLGIYVGGIDTEGAVTFGSSFLPGSNGVAVLDTTVWTEADLLGVDLDLQALVERRAPRRPHRVPVRPQHDPA